METGFITVGILVMIQLASFAYGYGRLSQKVNDLSQRLNDISHRLEKLELQRK